MTCHVRLLPLFPIAMLMGTAAYSAGVKVRFDPSTPAVGPFPTDALTVADANQKTGLRIALPMPDCAKEPSTCAELAIVNQLDGFSLTPRLRVRFSAGVNPDTLKDGIFIYWLGNLTTEETDPQPFATVTPINKIEYDPSTNTAYAEPDQILSQHRRYALIVTSAVKDTKGDPVEADTAYIACLQQPGAYCDQVAMAVGRAGPRLAPQDVVAASVFTTLSATAWMEKARAAIQTSNIGLALASPKAVFDVADISKITLHAQTGANKFKDIPMNGPEILTGVGKIVFGSLQSPLFIGRQLVIPPTPTKADVAVPAVSQEVAFNAFLPATPAPPGGYPVVIFGHGQPGDGFNGDKLAASMAARGFATISVTAFGHGYGAATKMLITDKSGSVTEVPRPGRGVEFDGNGTLDLSEGCVVYAGAQVVAARDCIRQTALDNMQLVRAIQAGMDLTGDGVVDLDRNHIYFMGYSFGSDVGAIVGAVEPAVQSLVLNACGAAVEGALWSPGNHMLVIAILAYRQPALINRPGPDFDGAFTLRNQPVRIIDVPGAIAIQELVERIAWNNMLGDPLPYAAHLSWSALPGVAAKPVLFQFALGDQSQPNPTESDMVRAANLRDMVSLFRTDAALKTPGAVLSPDPHDFAFDLSTSPAAVVVARAFQAQMALFFAGDGRSVPYVNDLVRIPFLRDLFLVPKALPDDLNY
jgi:hypothetical protein